MPEYPNNKHNKNIGRIGEEVACKFLMKQGYQIKEQNYLRKWGEIDIIATKDNILHIIEVKTVSRKINDKKNDLLSNPRPNQVSCEIKQDVTHETNDDYRPEDNIHPWKIKRLLRVIQTYLSENNLTDGNEWQFDAITVLLDTQSKKALVNHIKDIILS